MAHLFETFNPSGDTAVQYRFTILFFISLTFSTISFATQEKPTWLNLNHKDPKTCSAVGFPQNPIDIATKDNRTIKINRGNDPSTPVAIMVSFVPAEKISGQLSIAFGYPLKRESAPILDIDNTKFKLAIVPKETDSEIDRSWAWAENSDADNKIVRAMKLGQTAKITAVSPSGKQTVDSYSLIGFTAAFETAEKQCTN